MKQYHEKYALLVDLPSGHKKGTIFHRTTGQDNVLYWAAADTHHPLRRDMKSPIYTLEQMEQKKFFEPVGQPFDLILPFPSQEDLKEYFSLLGEPRLVNSVSIVRLINPVFQSDEFENAVYELLKKMYNEKYFGTGGGEPS